ncbi:hypothetical protein ACFUC1_01310 [Pedococcus sp. NPDC057267]|uniref:hypothetical protein n=1 Tax=Pedococcus sp. NPDC057267 TaxID=3346077 RepID=UPI0036306B20
MSGRRGLGTSVRSALAPVVMGVAVLLLVGACAADANPSVSSGPGVPGFWLGLWQGLISPITFLVSLFRDDVGIYAVRNSGGWYDFGFMLGVSIFFGGSARSGAAATRATGPRRRGPGRRPTG